MAWPSQPRTRFAAQAFALAAGLIGLASGRAMAEDVEHPAIEIQPPRPKPPPRPPAMPALPELPLLDQLTEADTPTASRFPFGLNGPRRLDLEGGSEFVWPDRPPEPKEAERVRDLLASYLSDLRAWDRVRSGKIDPAWMDLTQRIEHYWQPGFEHVRDPRISEVSGEWLADSCYRSARGWYREAQRNRKDPFVTPERVPGDEAGVATEGMLGWQRDMLNGDGWGKQVVSLVEIRFGSGGQAEARLVASSGHPLYDQVALEGVHEAITNTWGDAPPPGPVRTLVAMQAKYIILPPLPVVGFAFDEMLGLFDPIYPFKKKVTAKAVLVAVYRDSKPVDEPPGQDGGQLDGGVEGGDQAAP